MSWGAHNAVFGYDLNRDDALDYYAKESVYAVYQKNKTQILAQGMNIIMRWGAVDPVALLSNQTMFDLLHNDGLSITKEVISGYDHNSTYYDGGRMYQNMQFHQNNMIFSGYTPPAETKCQLKKIINNPYFKFSTIILDQGNAPLSEDSKVIYAQYDDNSTLISIQIDDIPEEPLLSYQLNDNAAYVSAYVWGMNGLIPVTTKLSASAE